MEDDPIVAELHKIREQLLEDHGGLQGLVEYIRKVQAQMPARVESLEPKPLVESHRKIS
jgi:hypothetical protein